MKLKRVDRTKDDWQKCCRWCHYYKNGKCIKDNVSIDETAPVWKVAEEGHLSETLEEFFGSVKLEEFRELEYLLRGYNLSEKRIREFNDLFRKCWEDFSQNTLKTELEENVAKCYQNHIEDNTTSDGLYIEDPENFVCKDWC